MTPCLSLVMVRWNLTNLKLPFTLTGDEDVGACCGRGRDIAGFVRSVSPQKGTSAPRYWLQIRMQVRRTAWNV